MISIIQFFSGQFHKIYVALNSISVAKGVSLLGIIVVLSVILLALSLLPRVRG